MSLRHIHFPLKDAGLRDDVGMLGALVGDPLGYALGAHVHVRLVHTGDSL